MSDVDTPVAPAPDNLHNLQHLADTLPQIVWITQPDGYHEYYNRRWWDYSGLTFEEACGDGWSLMLHPEDQQRAIERWGQSLRTGEIYEIEYRIRRASDGVYRWFLGRALPQRGSEGQIVRWFGTCTDIHDQKMAGEKMEAANRQKDQFLAILSHELRTPLNSILGWAELMQAGVLDPGEFKEAIRAIEHNARAQSRLIDDVIDVSRIINQKLHIEQKILLLESALTPALAALRPAAKTKDIRVEYRNERPDLLVRGDFERLKQVFGNLLCNAVKFTPSCGRISCTVNLDGSSARIRISDNGEGIAPDFLPEIFNLFRQADATSTRKHGGLGLGLALVRHLLEAQGGTVEAESPGEGQGATFEVRLPIVVVESSSTDSSADGTDAPPARDVLSGLRILVVDDASSVRELVATILTKYGAVVSAAGSAREAIDEFARNIPDVVVADIAMPEMDGYGLIAHLRNLPAGEGGSTPALALTAFASRQDEQRALRAGFQAHLAKPVRPAVLVRAVQSLCPR